MALSLDNFIEPVSTGLDPSVAGGSLEREVLEVFEAHELLMCQRHLRGLLVLASKHEWEPRSADDRPHLRMSTFTRFHVFANSDNEKKAGDAFLQAFEATQRDRLSRL